MIRLVCSGLLVGLFSACQREEVKRHPVEEFNEVSVMTYNILYNTSNDHTLEVLKETGADIIGLQEASPARIAQLGQGLRYYHHSFSKTSANQSSEDTGILSRFPITKYFENGVLVKVNPTLEVALFTVHLLSYPYEPYDFRDGLIQTAEQAIASATLNRLPGIEPVVTEINNALADGYPVFLTGDFNEPSHLDWTAATAGNQMHFGKVVEWPVSKQITGAGLIDAYRTKFPDAANFPGNTWTTIQTDNEVYDRIDMICHTSTSAIALTDIRTVGGPGDAAGITVENYPSDHYAVIAYYSLTR